MYFIICSSADSYRVPGEWSIGGRTSGKGGRGGNESSNSVEDKDATSVSWFLRNAWSSPLDQATSSSSSSSSSSSFSTTATLSGGVKAAAGGGGVSPLGLGLGLGSGLGLGPVDSFRLAYLPNWWFSLALAAYNAGKMFSHRWVGEWVTPLCLCRPVLYINPTPLRQH